MLVVFSNILYLSCNLISYVESSIPRESRVKTLKSISYTFIYQPKYKINSTQCRACDIGGGGAHAPCSDPNSTDKGTHLVFGSLKLLKLKAHLTN